MGKMYNVSNALAVECFRPYGTQKKIFEELNSKFDPKFGRKGKQVMVGEESELFFRGRGKYEDIRYDRVMVCHRGNPERRTFGYFIRRVYWEGRSEIRRKRFLSHLFWGV